MSFNGHWWFIALSSIFENVFLLLKVPTIGRMLSIRFDLLTKHILWRVFSVCSKDVLIFKNVFRCNILLHLYAMYTNLIAVASFKVIDRIYLFNLKHIDSIFTFIYYCFYTLHLHKPYRYDAVPSSHVPPFSHGTLPQSSWLISQFVPRNPVGHVQLYPPNVCWHAPLFKHGEGVQKSTVVLQVGPVQMQL